jgi:pimeloyl-ACP methyl ester carboxylesterase
MSPETLTVDVPGGALATDRWPGDGPTVVLLHAGVADRRGWTEVADRLARTGLDVVAYDRRGFGGSPPGDAPFSHLDDLRAVLDATAGDRPAWLVGNSMGGALALDAAVTAPERVAGLVLIAPAVSGQPDPEELDPQMRRGMAAWTEASGDPEALLRFETQWWLDGPDAPEGRVGGAARELALDMNRKVIANAVPEGAGHAGVDAWARLGELDLPVTILCGNRDEDFGIATCRALAEQIPGARFELLPGVAHLPSLEIPERLATLIQASTSGR